MTIRNATLTPTSTWTPLSFAVQRLTDGWFLGHNLRWGPQFCALAPEQIAWSQGAREGMVVEDQGAMTFVRKGYVVNLMITNRATSYPVRISEVNGPTLDHVRPGSDLRRSESWQQNPLAKDLPC